MSTRAPTIVLPVQRLIVTALALMLLAIPFPVLGAKGTAINAGVTPLITAVSPNQTTAFRATFQNSGSSTITQLAFVATISSGAWESDLLPGGCSDPVGGTVSCVLGSVPSMTTIVLDFYVTAPGTGSTALTGTFSADAAQNNGKAQKRDTWGPYTATTAVDTSGQSFARWQIAHGERIQLPPEGFVGSQGFQASAASVPPFAGEYPARLFQVDESITCMDGGEATTYTGVGHAVGMTIAGGRSPVDLEIRYTPEASERKAATQIAVVHEKDDGTCGFPARTAGPNCDFALYPDGCFQAAIEGNGAARQLVVKMQLPSNGKIKGI
jgi:hypothetical protein